MLHCNSDEYCNCNMSKKSTRVFKVKCYTLLTIRLFSETINDTDTLPSGQSLTTMPPAPSAPTLSLWLYLNIRTCDTAFMNFMTPTVYSKERNIQ